MAKSIRSVFATCGIVCAISLPFGFMLPAGRPAPAPPEDGEKFVMAEMAVLDPEHEPECAAVES
jgi:hypothetical protein